ncbi:MAG TPA: TonB-dependent receptor [Bryobacteraceae bacterium]|nr:TonB-dependent receptor [Bryobacteraceae bacterium]
MKPSRRRARLCSAILAALLLPILLRAQGAGGEIRVEVKDPSGAATQASGRLEGLTVSYRKNFDTDSAGRYTAPNLAEGTYRLTVSRLGFATQVVRLVIGSAPVSRTINLVLAAQTSSIEVVAATPLPGTDVPINDIPAPVQTVSAADIQQTGALDLADMMNKRLGSVHINENQGNPFQPDVNYRGYTASPLLGTPEGLSVYMDGVRQNQPLGDVVTWDLIPKIAISEMALIPGSNPLFGLNTLGGALSLQTKDGLSAPGTMIEINGGSFGRRSGAFEHGGSTKGGFNYYVAGNLFKEDGWRKYSPSEVRQIFGKIGQRFRKTYASLSFGYADNYLAGNGTQDGRWLARDYTSVYTITDANWNRSPSLTLNMNHEFSNSFQVSGNAYFRYIRTDTINPNLNSNSFDESLYNLSAADQAALKAAGYTGFPTTGNATTEPFPFWRCIAQGLEHNEPVEKCDANIVRGYDQQHNYGFSAQASWRVGRHRITAGAEWDGNGVTFQQTTQFGYLNADRVSITPVPFFADGSSNSNGIPVDNRVNLHGTVNTPGIFATDTFTINRWTITVSGRYNHEHLQNYDRIPGSIPGSPGSDGGRGSLNGDYVFQRFNPSAGLTYSPGRLATLYFNYSEANRAPTTIELGCADPNFPCNLPNALVGDPPLKQVVTRTFEAGARGGGENGFRWNADYFFSQNYNDLLFVSSETTGLGYFLNFGKTRRDGVEFSFSKRISKLNLGANYTFQNVTYQSPQSIDGAANSANDGGLGIDGNIAIKPGDFIPQMPRNIGKAFLEFAPTPKIFAALNFVAVGRSYARGNENNLHQPDGVYYLGEGFSPGYGVLNLGGHYQVQRHIEVFAQINNLLNHHYYTAAQLGTTPFDNNYNLVIRPFPVTPDGNYPVRSSTFFAPGAPIGAWGGIRFRF